MSHGSQDTDAMPGGEAEARDVFSAAAEGDLAALQRLLSTGARTDFRSEVRPVC